MSVRQSLLVALVSVAGFGSLPMASADAATFTCPDTMAADRPGAASSLSELYAGADDITARDQLGELMADLRKSGMKPVLIVDHLIGAYCPLVAADTILSDKQKADRVRQFARLVTGLAYVPSDLDEVDILVQTALPPDLLSQVDQAAGRAGLSRDEWIERSIKQQLSVS